MRCWAVEDGRAFRFLSGKMGLALLLRSNQSVSKLLLFSRKVALSH
jgi:hypothetical protein